MNVSEIKKTLVEKYLSIKKLCDGLERQENVSEEENIFLIQLEAQVDLLENLIKDLF